MKLVIMRHGQAELLHEPDETRALTSFGKQQVTQAAKWLNNHLGESRQIDLALVSPFIRAQQTYEQLSLEVIIKKKLVNHDVIPDGNPELLHDYIHALTELDPLIDTILIVSHMPFVCCFLEEIHQDKQSMLFDTSSIVIVDYDTVSRTGFFNEVFHP